MSATASNNKGGAYATTRRGGIDAWESAFIDQKRALGVSDFTIAKMLGRPLCAVQATPKLIKLEAIAPPTRQPRPAPKRKPTVTGSRRRYKPRDMPSRIRAMIAEVAARRGLTVEDLIGDSRKAYVAHARHEAFAIIYEFRKPSTLQHLYSTPLIGSWFGGRDPTTVRSGVIAHWARVAADGLAEAA